VDEPYTPNERLQPFNVSVEESREMMDLIRRAGGDTYRAGDPEKGPKHAKLPQLLVDELGPGYSIDFPLAILTREKWNYLLEVLREYVRISGTGAAGGKDSAGSGAGSTVAQGESRIPPATGSTPGTKAAPQPFVPKPAKAIEPIDEEIPF
jgi:hypothetical protein